MKIDGKPIINNPYKIFPFHTLDHTNLNDGTRTCFQPAATQPIQIKGVDNSSCTSHFGQSEKAGHLNKLLRDSVTQNASATAQLSEQEVLHLKEKSNLLEQIKQML